MQIKLKRNFNFYFCQNVPPLKFVFASCMRLLHSFYRGLPPMSLLCSSLFSVCWTFWWPGIHCITIVSGVLLYTHVDNTPSAHELWLPACQIETCSCEKSLKRWYTCTYTYCKPSQGFSFTSSNLLLQY